MYDSGTISGGVVSAGALAATGFGAGQWWLIAVAIGLVALGLIIIRITSRKAVTRVRLASWDELDDALGVDPHGWE